MLSIHLHSNYSLLQGTIPIDQIISFAKENNCTYAALTDTNAMYGLLQFAQRSAQNGIKPILGAQIDDPQNKNYSAIFLAKNNEGYSELCKLITSRKLKEDFSLIDAVKNSSGNLFILISSYELLKFLLPISNSNIYVELISTKRQKKNTRALYEFALENKLPIVATHPAYFITPEDHLLQKVVTAIRLNTTLKNISDEDTIDEECSLVKPEVLKKTWRAFPETLWNVEHIVQNCNVNLKFGEHKFPNYPLPNGETSFSYLWKIAFRGLEEKYKPITDKAVKRLQYELEVIDELGYCDYFLVVWDIVRESKSRQMMSIGRGSAANSLVAYCLGFTQVDPIEQNLYFERFLNRGRKSPPDVDLDFSWRERDEIVKYVYDRYGYDKVAMISTTVTFRARSAFREVAKVFGISESEINKFSKFIPWTSAHNLPHLAEKFPEAKSLHFKEEPWKSIIDIASKLAGFPRHLSIHPSGIIVAPESMTNYVALEYAKNKGLGLIITQPDMYPIEEFGLVKIDLLSQRSLGVLRDTMKRIKGKMKDDKPVSTQIFKIN
ncbi:MAG: DNA polymerase III subunit alpha [Melioribacteraceae bacterium]|nr:DNA polymerase III subunit alpha [Melioribacteraceae bacterium]